MKEEKEKQIVLAIDPIVRGIGYTVFEGASNPIDWGVTNIRINKNYRSLVKVKKLIACYQPDVVVLEETNGSLRQDRIRKLIKSIDQYCKKQGIKTVFYHRNDILFAFSDFGKSTKHEIAEAIAEWLPELSQRLPKKREFYMSEAPEYGIFDAAALALTHLYLDK